VTRIGSGKEWIPVADFRAPYRGGVEDPVDPVAPVLPVDPMLPVVPEAPVVPAVLDPVEPEFMPVVVSVPVVLEPGDPEFAPVMLEVSVLAPVAEPVVPVPVVSVVAAVSVVAVVAAFLAQPPTERLAAVRRAAVATMAVRVNATFMKQSPRFDASARSRRAGNRSNHGRSARFRTRQERLIFS
jgi:hypothetical protein